MKLANTLFIIAGILWGIELIPQIVKTIRRKTVEDISVFFFCICLVSYIIYLVGAYLIRQYVLIISHIPSFALLIVMLGLIFKYRKNK